MFRTLARLLVDPTLTTTTPPTPEVFRIHPLQLSRWLEETWALQRIAELDGLPNVVVSDPAVVTELRLPDGLRNDGLRAGIRDAANVKNFGGPPSVGTTMSLPGDHLVYAYLVESTGVFEILGEVVRRMVVGESLPTPSIESQHWLRSTEDLFFRDPPLFHVGSLVSEFRPDARVNRRNSYWRMFGMDLPHPVPRTRPGVEPGEVPPWKRDLGGAANIRFRELWSELLTYTWVGIEHDNNQIGPNPVDPSYLAYLCESIEQHFRQRRVNGMLAREEFFTVAALSWFHLTVELESPIVNDLNAQATNAADRLARIGRLVGIAPSAQSRELFELADAMSVILRFVEEGQFSNPANAQLLYDTGGGGPQPVRELMSRIIYLWQLATGERIKDSAVRVTNPRMAPSAVAPAPAPLAATSIPRPVPSGTGNGSRH